MNPQLPLSTRAFFWVWFTTSAAGCLFGVLIGIFPFLLTIEIQSDTPIIGFWVGLFWGACIGFLANLGPHYLLKRIRIGRVRWIFSSTIGGALGLSALLFFLNAIFDSLPPASSNLSKIFSLFFLIIFLSLFGLIMGFVQCLSLLYVNRSIRTFYLWPAINAIAYFLAISYLFLIQALPEHFSAIVPVFKSTSYVISPMIVGAITAAGMVWILARQGEVKAAPAV